MWIDEKADPLDYFHCHQPPRLFLFFPLTHTHTQRVLIWTKHIKERAARVRQWTKQKRENIFIYIKKEGPWWDRKQLAKHGHLSIGRVVNAAVTIYRPRQIDSVCVCARASESGHVRSANENRHATFSHQLYIYPFFSLSLLYLHQVLSWTQTSSSNNKAEEGYYHCIDPVPNI